MLLFSALKKPFFTLFLLLFLGTAFYTNVIFTNEQQYVYLAKSFLQGKVYFTQLPGTWEDVVLYKGKYYWHQGPFPAIALMPFVFVAQLFHVFFYQGYLQFFLTLGIFYLCYWLAKYYKYSREDGLFLAFAFCFASVYQIVSMVSWVWYFVQAITVLLLFLALYEYFTKRRYVVIGLLYAAVFASRFTAGLTIIFFLLALLKEKKPSIKKVAALSQLVVPLFLCGLLLLSYNYVRFGDVFNNGYMMNNNMFSESRGSYERDNHGLFKISNIPTNIYYYFIKTLDPVLIPVQTLWGNTYILEAPYVTVKYPGTSFFVVSPVFLYMFRNKLKSQVSRYALVAVIAVLIPLMLYYWPGWWQVGPRYLLDLLPFGYVLLLEGFEKRKLSRGVKILICISTLFDLYLLSLVGFRL
jgi:hypothetical protein